MIHPASTISIHGVPRSGTTWLGAIFNSHPDVAFRLQPLFAYRFKGRITQNSSVAEIAAFFSDLYTLSDDGFILRGEGILPDFEMFPKSPSPKCLVMKEVRYHYLLETFLQRAENFKAIGIIRDPRAVINSWLRAPREFKPEWNPAEEWRYAPKKNLDKPEEYNGYEKWKEVARMFLDLQSRYPQCFYLVRYEALVDNALEEVRKLFAFAELDMHEQTLQFLQSSQSNHSDHPYSVFKKRGQSKHWEQELDPLIADEILQDVSRSGLAEFLG